jgi:hypothetical protein
LKLARDQFETEWRPGVHIRVINKPSTDLEFVNLGRMAIVVTTLLVRFPDQDQKIFSYNVDFVLVAGAGDSLPIENQLLDAMNAVRQVPESGDKTVRVDLGVDYSALETPYQSAWFQFSLYASRGTFLPTTVLFLDRRFDADSRKT